MNVTDYAYKRPTVNGVEYSGNILFSEKYMDLDRPNVETIEVLREYYRRGWRIIILTGQVREKQENKTIRQLRQWNTPYHRMIFRTQQDYTPNPTYKAMQMRQLLRQYNIEAVYEDNQQTIDQINKQHPQIKIVKP